VGLFRFVETPVYEIAVFRPLGAGRDTALESKDHGLHSARDRHLHLRRSAEGALHVQQLVEFGLEPSLLRYLAQQDSAVHHDAYSPKINDAP
jgi:hypothetical protein